MEILKFIKIKTKNINKEYVLLFLVMSLFIFLAYTSSRVLSQAARVPTDITMTTYYPSSFSWFKEVQASQFNDLDNAGFFLDPTGQSILGDLWLNGDLTIRGRILGSALASRYYIDLNTNNNGAVGNPAGMFVRSILCEGTITMGAAENDVVSGPFPHDTGLPATDPLKWVLHPAGGKHIYEYIYDIAESIPTSEECQVNDVAVIDLTQEYHLKKSDKSFETNIAGVISEDPKFHMGPGAGKMPLALAGIVKCNVSAENGAIKRGDLLVSAAIPGHAMRAHPKKIKPGMLIGKALQPLKKGTGKILILVNKQ